MTSSEFTLGDAFEKVAYAQWRARVERDLKGAPFDKKLVSKTADGLRIEPLYSARDWSGADDPAGLPGRAPFTRGAHAAGRAQDGWAIRGEYAHPDPAEVNAAILADLEGGARAATLRFHRAARMAANEAGERGRDGVCLDDLDDLGRALRGLHPGMAYVGLDAGGAFMPAAMALVALADRADLPRENLHLALNADPLGALARDGRLPCSPERALRWMAALAQWTARRLPRATAVAVDASVYHEAGAAPAQELALALATAVAYLRALTAVGMDLETAARQILFNFSVDCRFFAEIAKLRAARKLWARVIEACGGGRDAQTMNLTANVSRRVLTRRDPWVNMLRNTLASFAAAAGGADAVTARPFDCALGQPDAFGRRVARNAQNILQEESHVHRVIDPSGGAWFVEAHTDQLAETAWSRFQEIEAAGGAARFLLDGGATAMIEATAETRGKAIAKRKQPITGVSEFPDLNEKTVSREQSAAPPQKPRRAAEAELAAAREAKEGGLVEAVLAAVRAGAGFVDVVNAMAGEEAPAEMNPLPMRPDAAPFEALRDAAEANASRPRAFLVNLGSKAEYAARAGFARNFLAAGGIETVDSGGFNDPNGAASAFCESGAAIAVICGTDEAYPELAPAVAAALKKRGARTVLLAGRPGANEEAWRAAGIDRFIHLGCDALEILTALLAAEEAP